MNPQEIRNIRLKSDYEEMCNLKGRIIDWKPLKGQPPLVDEYELNIRVNTIISERPDYRNMHRIEVILPPAYPRVAPIVSMLSKPQPFHPNWYVAGNWCHGSWSMSESLGTFVIRMIRTLQFDLEITNEHSPANTAANHWYKRNKASGLFPCDRQTLPDPTSDKKKTFRINR